MFVLQSPFPQFLGRDGKPLQNGHIYLGQPSANPIMFPRAAFWDAELTQPAPQPLRVTNGFVYRDGTPSKVFIGDKYSLLVNDQAGVQVLYQPEAVTGSVETLATDLADIADVGKGDALIGVKSTLPGAVARTQHGRNEETVSLGDFGAVGDGITIDTSAVQAALNSGARCIEAVSGKTYLIGPLTQNTDRQVILAFGADFRRINGSTHAAMLTLNGAGSRVYGGRWDGNKVSQSGLPGDKFAHSAVQISADDCVVESIESVNSWGIGIKGVSCSYPRIASNKCTDSDLYGIYVESTGADKYGLDIIDNTVTSVGLPEASGIYLTGSNAPFTFKQSLWKVRGNTCRGSIAVPTGIGITTRGIDGVVSENVTTGYTMGISADIASRTVISGNRCSDMAGATQYGIELNGSHCTVIGNVIRGGIYGVVASGNATMQSYSTVTGNMIDDASAAGIYFNGSTQPARHLNITGNTIIFTGSAVGRAGIRLAGDCKFSNISGNNIVGPGSGVASCRGVFLDGVGSHVSVTGNRFNGFERPIALYAVSALAYTDITFNDNDCSNDCGSAFNFVNIEGSATAGARITQVWNNSGSGVNYNVLDKATALSLQFSGSFATPEANVVGGIGSMYLNLNGGAGTTLFVKQSGAGNTGWAGK